MPLFTHSAALMAHVLSSTASHSSLSEFLSFHFHLSISTLVPQSFYRILMGPSSLTTSLASLLAPILLCLPLVCFFPSSPVISLATNKCLSSSVLWVSLRICAVRSGKEGFPQVLLTHEAVAAEVVSVMTYHLLETHLNMKHCWRLHRDHRSGSASSSLSFKEDFWDCHDGYTWAQTYLPHIHPICVHEQEDWKLSP